MSLLLVSHHLCPYVQRAAIVLAEKGQPFERRYVDLTRKPDWFVAISPLGKVPLLLVGDDVLFESAAICDFFDETIEPRMHPVEPIARARHRAWIEVVSSTLNDVAGLYNAQAVDAFDIKLLLLRDRFAKLEAQLGDGPWFGGSRFSLVDAAFAPLFRYLDIFEHLGIPSITHGLPKTAAYRAALSQRQSVRDAVTPDYGARLETFLAGRGSHLSRRYTSRAA